MKDEHLRDCDAIGHGNFYDCVSFVTTRFLDLTKRATNRNKHTSTKPHKTLLINMTNMQISP